MNLKQWVIGLSLLVGFVIMTRVIKVLIKRYKLRRAAVAEIRHSIPYWSDQEARAALDELVEQGMTLQDACKTAQSMGKPP